MTEAEWQSLKWFKNDRRNNAGVPLKKEGYSYATMIWMNELREHLNQPIMLIRGGGEHGEGKETAVDGVCKASLGQTFLGLTRLPGVSWGIYEGGSFHLDTREYDVLPARWFGFRDTPERLAELQSFGWSSLIEKRKDGHIYMFYNTPHSFEVLSYLIDLTDRH